MKQISVISTWCKRPRYCRQTYHKPTPRFSPPEEVASLSQSFIIVSSVCLSAAIKKIRFDMQHPVRCLVLTPAFFKKKMQKESALIGWSNVMCYVISECGILLSIR